LHCLFIYRVYHFAIQMFTCSFLFLSLLLFVMVLAGILCTADYHYVVHCIIKVLGHVKVFIVIANKLSSCSFAFKHTQLHMVTHILSQISLNDIHVNPFSVGPGTFTITVVAVAGAVGYAYIKWKGWKLSDLMFVTKRGLSDACNVVGSQLDKVSDDVTSARKHLAGRIDRVDISLDETQEIIEGTRDEVTVIHGDLSAFQEDLQSVNLVVRSLESKLVSLEYTQDHTANGISDLVEFTQKATIRQVPAASVPPAIGSSERVVRRVSSLPQSTALPALPTTAPAAEPSPRAEVPQVWFQFDVALCCMQFQFPLALSMIETSYCWTFAGGTVGFCEQSII
jgi:hypothetical protein